MKKLELGEKSKKIKSYKITNISAVKYSRLPNNVPHSYYDIVLLSYYQTKKLSNLNIHEFFLENNRNK